MNLVRIGNATFNMALMVEIREFHMNGKTAIPRVEIVFVTGSMAALEGDEALALRAFLVKHSAVVTPAPQEPNYGADGGGTSLPFHPEGTEEGT